MVQILLIEDDATIAAGLAYSLEQEGWKVTCKGTLAQGREAMAAGGYQLLLVDVGLPDGSGYDLCADAKSRNIPIIFVTARGDEGSVVLGLDMGADDYIVKPFRLREVVSRIRAVLRRAAGEREQLVRLGELTVNTQKGQVTRSGNPIPLTAMEYRLLLTFLAHPGQILTRGQLLEGIWDVAGNFVNDNTLSVYIKRLRDKLETPGQTLISTVRGMGYRLEVDGHDKK
ncbi:MAG TPA: response regulator transcription factor [Candidatus Ruthenibacterium merdigallinarum]|nr:response regulator transcription factor [Candidatus Ruthenibacterium merdigallinarum]